MDKHLNYFEVRWKNFKGFQDTGWVKIKPITIILGSNNAGKTNFLAPLLLLNQTINSRDRNSSLILKGNIYDGGNFQEIVKDYDTNNEIYFGYKYHIHESDEKLDQIGAYPPVAKLGEFNGGIPVYEFHPKTGPQQVQLFEDTSEGIERLARKLLTTFSGKKITVEAIYNAHHIDTPYILSNYKQALLILEEEGKITVDKPAHARPKRHGKVTLGNDRVIQFL